MKEVLFVDEIICDYDCRTVGEGINKYNIPDDWCAEFDAYDDNYPIFCIQACQIRKKPAIMDLKLRIVKNEDDEYAGCIVLPDQKTIAFKIDNINNLVNAIGAKQEDNNTSAE